MGALPIDDATNTLADAAELFTTINGKGGKEDKQRKTMIRSIISFGIVIFAITAGATAWCVSTGNAIQDLFHKHTETSKAIADTRIEMHEGFDKINTKVDRSNAKLDTLIGAVNGAKEINP